MKLLKITYRNRSVEETIRAPGCRPMIYLKDYAFINPDQLESIHRADNVEKIEEFEVRAINEIDKTELEPAVADILSRDFIGKAHSSIEDLKLDIEKVDALMGKGKYKEVIEFCNKRKAP